MHAIQISLIVVVVVVVDANSLHTPLRLQLAFDLGCHPCKYAAFVNHVTTSSSHVD
jgi:hypothetical protein